ncbi:MAG TPA: hypothetical protein VFP93_00685 [Gammaproteobacteria bacterium]|nr:hypothetical protein [Gammaproteobacteria bacterium]
MNCIHHSTSVAVCQCVICHKGLCVDCFHELESLCVCKVGTCDKEALVYKNLLNMHKKHTFIPYLYLILGLLFILLGSWNIVEHHYSVFDIAMVILGGLFALQGLPAHKTK